MRKAILCVAVLALAACGQGKQADETMKQAKATEAQPAQETHAVADHAQTDPRLWLEEVHGEKALDWVKGENKRTLDIIENDPDFQKFDDEALKILDAKDKIDYGTERGGFVYNFWRDENHVRGIWRRTTLTDYAMGNPKWDVLLDMDKLAKDEGKNWVYKGSSCRPPEYDDCMITLSDGGLDASYRREFDIKTRSFVDGGFSMPQSKAGTAWADPNTLLVATDWGNDTMTDSGYPFVIKLWERGTPLEDAKEVLRGKKSDVGVWPLRVELNDKPYMFGIESTTFYKTTYWYLPENAKPVKLPVPEKSSFQDVYAGQAVFTLEQDWTPEEGGATFASGSVVSFDLAHFLQTGTLGNVHLVLAPGPRMSVEGVSATKSALVVNTLDNVTSKLFAYTFTDGKWTGAELNLPANANISIRSANDHSDIMFVNVTSFLVPDSLYMVDVPKNTAKVIRQLPSRFDTSDLVTDQMEATSKDGTKIPYFLVHKKGIKMDGTTPTVLYGYGGFQASILPSYSGYASNYGTIGKLWLERGGAYAIANIRGGGEFGPKWHEAALLTNRQKAYDDFIAVAEDMINKGVTSPRHLGIRGRSNGGLLMGVMYTERPDLFNAVWCGSPLLDMLRYNKLLAGASWEAEYGDPSTDPAIKAFWDKTSPYQNVDPNKKYPEIFFVTSTKDDRVHPGHARKMAKELQDDGKNFLYYENIDGGHANVTNAKETARREAMATVFFSRQLMARDAAEDVPPK